MKNLNLNSLLKRINTLPLFFLFLLAVTFGWFAFHLGYIWDDWEVLFLKRTYGFSGLNHLLTIGGRPLYIWLYFLTMNLLGDKPHHWHLFAIFARWLAVLSMWWALRGLWPKQSRAVTWAAILFANYPIFFLQSLALIMSQDWLLYAIFFVSLGSMIWAQSNPKHFLPLTALSLLTAVLHMFTKEYYLGLELLRPIVLWIALSNKQRNTRVRLIQVLKHWVPYLGILLVFIFWRLFILHPENEQNPLVLIKALRTDFSTASMHFLQSVLRNFLYATLGIWGRALDPNQIELDSRFSLAIWGIAAFIAIACFWAMKNFQDVSKEKNATPSNWPSQALMVGALSIFVGLIPTWSVGKDPLIGLFADRFNLPTMFGAAIFMTGLVSWLIRDRTRQNIVFAVLTGLAVSILIRQNNEFRWAWDKQHDYYWQLIWRAPDLQPGTAILGDGALVAFVDGYAAASAINLLYPQEENSIPFESSYWYLDFHGFDGQQTEFLAGVPLFAQSPNEIFNGHSHQVLFVYNEPGLGQCLWVLSQKDAGNHELPPIVRELLPVADLGLIQIEPRDPSYPPRDIFGTEPEHDWCYFYEKADLARQLEDWQQVLDLENQAEQLGKKPNSPFELLPFIEAHAFLGQWEEAFELSRDAFRRMPQTRTQLCTNWQRFAAETQANQIRDRVIAELNQLLDCP